MKARHPGEPALTAVAAMVSVGFVPLNLLPFTVVAYSTSLGLSSAYSGMLGTTEMSGAVLGSLVALLLMNKVPLARLAFFGALAGAGFEVLSCGMHDFYGMAIARLMVGLSCGIVLAAGNAIAASAKDPARFYMRVLAVQSALTIFIWSAMPKLLSFAGANGAFGGAAVALAALASAMLLVPARLSAPAAPAPGAGPQAKAGVATRPGPVTVAMALLAVLTCCMRDGVAWTFSDKIAIEVGLSDLGQSLLYAGIGALGLIVLLTSARLDIWKRPVANVAGAIIVASVTTTGLLFSHEWSVFVALALPWAAAQFLALSFLTGLAAELDASGRLSAATGAAFQCAYAVAPALAGFVFSRMGYNAVGALATVLSALTLASGSWLAQQAMRVRNCR